MGNGVILSREDPPLVSNTVREVLNELTLLYADPNWAIHERRVEIEWVGKNLIQAGRILDVGCCDSRLASTLSHHDNYEVHGIDIRDYGWMYKVSFKREDIRRTTYPSNFFDQIIAVSTIEHVGMNCYGNTWIDKEHGDRMAVLEMYRILKPSGSLLITLPYGTSTGDYWIRYYNEYTLTKLLHGLTPHPTYYLKENGRWRECVEPEASQKPSGEGALPQAIVCVRAEK